MGKRSFWSTEAKVEFKESAYSGAFRQGATIVPRCFWFVEVQKSGLGFDESLPSLVSSERAQEQAKKAYKNCVIKGAVESRFLYATLLPVDMIPFGHLRIRPVVLPIKSGGSGFQIYRRDQAREAGFVHLAEWLDRVEHEWIQRRGSNAENMDSIKWLDYRRKLSGQQSNVFFRVIYAMSGTHVCACVLSSQKMARRVATGVKVNGFAVDYTTYYFDACSESEAIYVATALNAPCVDSAIKQGQAKGLWGARHVCKKVLDLPIPLFDKDSTSHVRLVEIGESCAERVKGWIADGGPGDIKSTGVLRRNVREMLSEEFGEIDSIVKPMLGL